MGKVFKRSLSIMAVFGILLSASSCKSNDPSGSLINVSGDPSGNGAIEQFIGEEIIGDVELISTRVDNGTFYITTRVGSSKSTTNIKDFITSDKNYNDIYPGAIVDPNLTAISANQTFIDDNNITRDKLTVSVDVKGDTTLNIDVENPNRETIEGYIRKELKGHNAKAEVEVKTALVNNEKQLNDTLGLFNDYRIDYKNITTGNYNYMIAIFDQVYYSTKSKIEADTSISGTDSSNKRYAEITDIDYGRRVIVKFSLSTDYLVNPGEEWKASVTNTGFTDSELLKNGFIETFSIGGSNDSFVHQNFDSSDIQELNDFINSELDYNRDNVAIPLSYKMNYIDDHSQVYANQTIDDNNIRIEKREPVQIQLDKAHGYTTKVARLYAKKIIGVNKDGSYILSNWINLIDTDVLEKEYYISGEYAEFAFSFDITSGENWPYTDIFWRATQPAPKKVYIEWGGGSFTPWIEITVDGNKIVDKSNLKSNDKDKFEDALNNK